VEKIIKNKTRDLTVKDIKGIVSLKQKVVYKYDGGGLIID